MEALPTAFFPAVLLEGVRAERVVPVQFWQTIGAIPAEEQPFRSCDERYGAP